MAHSLWSPSAAERNMNCAGAALLSQDQPNNSSLASASGTVIHRIGEHGLRNDGDIDFYLGTKEFCDGFEIDITDREVAIARAYIDYVFKRTEELSGDLLIEQRLHATEIHKECYGSGDAVIIAPETIEVIDLKTGKYPVDAVNNKQLKIYALGALEMFGTESVKTVSTTIVQPTTYHKEGNVRSFEYDVAGLVDWGFNVLKPAILASFSPDPSYTEGSWCRWCPAKSICPLKSKEVFENETIGHTKVEQDQAATHRADGVGWDW